MSWWADMEAWVHFPLLGEAESCQEGQEVVLKITQGGPPYFRNLALGFYATRSAKTWQLPSACDTSHTPRRSLQIKYPRHPQLYHTYNFSAFIKVTAKL